MYPPLGFSKRTAQPLELSIVLTMASLQLGGTLVSPKSLPFLSINAIFITLFFSVTFTPPSQIISFQSSRQQPLEVDRGGILKMVTRSVLLQRTSSGDYIIILNLCQAFELSFNCSKKQWAKINGGLAIIDASFLRYDINVKLNRSKIYYLYFQEYMNQESGQIMSLANFFEQSQQFYPTNYCNFYHVDSDLSLLDQEDKARQAKPNKYKKSRNRARLPKLQKNQEIRTNRNVQKIYHNILKHWLQNQKYAQILPKYSSFFHQRVYFILVLDEISKQVDGQAFAASYEHLARQVMARKYSEIQVAQQEKQNTKHSHHLRRVIDEIEFSITACKQFIAGNVLDSLVTVYKRGQGRITKLNEFQKAVKAYREVTGHDPQNY